VIVSSRQDYETLRNLIAKIDVAKDQVFIKTIIMEMASTLGDTWSVNVYKFAGDTNGVGRIGFRGTSDIQSIVSPASDSGAVLALGGGGLVNVTIAGQTVQVPSLTSFINLLKSDSPTNIVSTPQIMAHNTAPSSIEVGAVVPVSKNDSTGVGGVVNSTITREDVTTKLEITPYISPDTDEVKMKINQNVANLSTVQVAASELAKNAIATTKRNIKTQIVVNSGDTAVLGGLMSDDDEDNVVKVPVLGDIPILGWLFKSENKKKAKNNLVVFITPKILRNPDEAGAIVDEKINERIDFIQRAMNGRDPHGSYIDALPRRKTSKKSTNPKAESPAVETF
jgi:general secretion pathway protein D